MEDVFITKRRPGAWRVVQDELLIRSEVYNGNEVDAIFFRIKEKDAYVAGSGVDPGPDYIVCKSKEFAILPTSHYIPVYYTKGHAGEEKHMVHLSPGEQRWIRNYGDQIGKGNVLPSAPEVRVSRRSKR